MTAPKLRKAPRPIGIGDILDQFLNRAGHRVAFDPPVECVDACAAFLMVARPGEPWITVVNASATTEDYSKGQTVTASWLHRVGDLDGRWAKFPERQARPSEAA